MSERFRAVKVEGPPINPVVEVNVPKAVAEDMVTASVNVDVSINTAGVKNVGVELTKLDIVVSVVDLKLTNLVC